MIVRFTIYKAKDGVRWHAKRCGRIIAESGEAYSSLRTCKKTLDNLIGSMRERNYALVIDVP